LSTTGSGHFYANADATCTGGTITTTSIGSGANQAQVRYRDDTAEAVTLTAADAIAFLNSGTFNLTMGASKLVMSGPANAPAAACSLFTITSKDQSGNATNVTSNRR